VEHSALKCQILVWNEERSKSYPIPSVNKYIYIYIYVCMYKYTCIAFTSNVELVWSELWEPPKPVDDKGVWIFSWCWKHSSINKWHLVKSKEQRSKKILCDSKITSDGVTKLTYITGGVGVGKSYSSRAFQKQKINSCRNHIWLRMIITFSSIVFLNNRYLYWCQTLTSDLRM